MSRPRITTLKEGMMPERVSIPIVGATVIAGIGLDQLGGAAVVVAIVTILIITLAIIFIWIRVGQLTKETSNLSGGIADLNAKISKFETTLKQTDSFIE